MLNVEKTPFLILTCKIIIRFTYEVAQCYLSRMRNVIQRNETFSNLNYYLK